jgi:hypothetical protein
MLLQELSQIQVEIEDRFASEKVIEEQNLHEPHLQQADLEALFDNHCQSTEETKGPWEAFNGEQALEPNIEEFLSSLCLDPLCKSQILKIYRA